MVVKARAVREPQNTKKMNLFSVRVSLMVGLGDRNLVEQASFLNEKAAVATLGWQIKERGSTYAFSCLRDGGWEFFLVVSDAMGTNLPFIKEKLCCGCTDCPAVVSVYENHFLRAVKRKFSAFSTELRGTDISLC